METTHGGSLAWHTDALPAQTRRALKRLETATWLKRSPWYLAGGTALALQVGHRSSVDLDFFLPRKAFLNVSVLKHFSSSEWKSDIVREGTVYGRLRGAKVSFIAYPFFVPQRPFRWYGNIRILDAAGIAVMKIVAISQRGRKRDFVDLYWYCKNRESLLAVVSRLSAQYPTVAHDFHHILKSLTYFADAESDPMPKLFFKATWLAVKKFFEFEVRKAAREILQLR